MSRIRENFVAHRAMPGSPRTTAVAAFINEAKAFLPELGASSQGEELHPKCRASICSVRAGLKYFLCKIQGYVTVQATVLATVVNELKF